MIQEILDTIPGRKIIVLLGLQWGDEGKGKVSDAITHYFDASQYVVVGPNGGGNAGHNVVIEKSALTGEKIKLAFHELPGGVVEAQNIFLAQARVINFRNLIKEIEEIELHHPNPSRTIYIASRAIVNLDGVYNKIEEVTEEAKGDKKVGTTKQGIGPAYAGEALRTAITVGQMFTLSNEELEAKIREQCLTFPYIDKGVILKNMFETKQSIEELVSKGKIIIVSDDYLTSTECAQKHILIEGAQSVGLGKFGGAYPNNTSSDCSVHGLLSSSLLPKADLVFGVTKAIVSKVGSGRFLSRLDDNGVSEDFIDRYRKVAGEFGATTGRARDVGFLDAVQLRHSFKTGNKPDVLWINMGDMLKFFSDNKIENKIVVGYKVLRQDPTQNTKKEIHLIDSIPLQEDEIQEIQLESLPEVLDIEKDLSKWLEVVRSHLDFNGPVVVGTGPSGESNIYFPAK